ncbi:MAG TPA: class I SAM-dependent methyltransferase [Bryobacterales bacterium]|nr:class I SAM-dependent methyltransferase [Bryobacterales bacterium]
MVVAYLRNLSRGASLLDLGCGNGTMLASFRDRGWQLTGADVSSSGIQLARRTWPGIHFERLDATGDVSMLGLGQYDAIISTEVIEHVFLPHEFVKNCYRLLKPGGILILSTPYHGYLKNLVIALTGGFDRHWNPLFDYGHIKFWSVSTLSHLLYEAGFDNLEWRGAGRMPHLWKSFVIKATKPS